MIIPLPQIQIGQMSVTDTNMHMQSTGKPLKDLNFTH